MPKLRQQPTVPTAKARKHLRDLQRLREQAAGRSRWTGAAVREAATEKLTEQ